MAPAKRQPSFQQWKKRRESLPLDKQSPFHPDSQIGTLPTTPEGEESDDSLLSRVDTRDSLNANGFLRETGSPPDMSMVYCLVHLRELHLEGNHLGEKLTTTKGLNGLIQLRVLDLGSNDLTCLPHGWDKLVHLEHLSVWNNQLSKLPETLKHCEKLSELRLTKNNFETLPRFIGDFKKLEVLEVDNNFLKKIPPELCECAALQHLSIRANELKHLPTEIGALANTLETLICSLNLLVELPEGVGLCTKLKVLRLGKNAKLTMDKIPKSVQDLPCFNPSDAATPLKSRRR